MGEKEDILNGKISKQLLLFFFPILLGYIFQQLYNTIDAVIVGKFVGKTALAAVGGTTGTSLNLLVNFIWGLTSGINVIIAQYYGRRDFDGVKETVRTGMFIGIVLGFLMSVFGIIVTPGLLSLLNVSEDFFAQSVSYMRIYLIGLIPLMIYNVGAATLRATGDSKRPLFFLILSAIINTVLDYILVKYFNMGVEGAAIATVFAEVVCAVLMLILLHNTSDAYQYSLNTFGYDLELLKKTIYIGLPSGIQSVVYSVSNLYIQASVNAFGTDTVAAYTAFGKIDGFYWNYDSAFGIACMTLVGQNYGAKNIDRVKETIKMSLLLEVFGTVLISGICYFFAGPLISIFTKDVNVISIGVTMLTFLSITWVLFNPIEILSSAFKACGNTVIPMITSIIGICGVRILYLTIVPYKNVMEALYCYPLSWLITSILFVAYYLTGRWMRKNV